MDILDALRRMAHNHLWSNHRLHAAVATLDADAYRASRTSFFPSIHRTLVHILYVDLFYLDGLEAGGVGQGLWPAYERDERDATFAQVREQQAATDRRLIAFVEALRSDELEREVRMQRQVGVRIDTCGEVLLHLFQHQIHHRGQVHAMLSGTAAAPPQLDEFFLREDLPLRERELQALGLPRTYDGGDGGG
jgi:uncharacterized damage-inducible protein DinB